MKVPGPTVALIVLLPVVVFWGALDNGFHLDDFYRVADNPGIESVSPVWRHFTDPGTSASLPRLVQYRPLLPLTLSINHALTGDSLVGYHAGNLLIHVLGALALYVLLRELLSQGGDDDRASRSTALAATLVYAIHPVAGVPVNYICARDLLLMQLFLFVSLLGYVGLRRRGHAALGWFVALAGMALSLLSKTNAVVLPAVVLAYETCLRREGGRSWLRALPFAVVAAGFFVLTTAVLGFSDAAQLDLFRDRVGAHIEYARTQLALHLVHYLRNAVWPWQMRPLPDVAPVAGWGDPRMLAGLVVVAASLAWAWRRRRAHPVGAFAVLCYWLLFVPTSSILPLRYLATDYRALPSLPWLALAGCLIGRRWLPARLRPASLGLALAWIAAASVVQNSVWETERSLWEKSVRHGGRAMAHVNYARQVEETDVDLARHHYDEALRRDPGNVLALVNLGLLEIRAGNTELGLATVRRAVALTPEWADVRHWMARALVLAGRWEEAANEDREAVRLEPGNPSYREAATTTLYDAAQAAQSAGNTDLALARLQALHEVVDRHADSRFREGWAHHQRGELQWAIDDYRLHLASDTGHVQAQFNLAHALMESDAHAEAVTAFEQTLRLDPEYRDAHYHLATCLEAIGDAEGARRQRELFEASARQGGS